jgi:hypothetical protein
MAITNKITITQDEKEPIVIRLLEKSYAPDRDYAAGHWYVDDGNCGHDVYFMVVTPEDRFWYYNPTSTGGMLGIGARVQTRDDPLTLITHVFLVWGQAIADRKVFGGLGKRPRHRSSLLQGDHETRRWWLRPKWNASGKACDLADSRRGW